MEKIDIHKQTTTVIENMKNNIILNKEKEKEKKY